MIFYLILIFYLLTLIITLILKKNNLINQKFFTFIFFFLIFPLTIFFGLEIFKKLSNFNFFKVFAVEISNNSLIDYKNKQKELLSKMTNDLKFDGFFNVYDLEELVSNKRNFENSKESFFFSFFGKIKSFFSFFFQKKKKKKNSKSENISYDFNKKITPIAIDDVFENDFEKFSSFYFTNHQFLKTRKSLVKLDLDFETLFLNFDFDLTKFSKKVLKSESYNNKILGKNSNIFNNLIIDKKDQFFNFEKQSLFIKRLKTPFFFKTIESDLTNFENPNKANCLNLEKPFFLNNRKFYFNKNKNNEKIFHLFKIDEYNFSNSQKLDEFLFQLTLDDSLISEELKNNKYCNFLLQKFVKENKNFILQLIFLSPNYYSFLINLKLHFFYNNSLFLNIINQKNVSLFDLNNVVTYLFSFDFDKLKLQKHLKDLNNCLLIYQKFNDLTFCRQFLLSKSFDFDPELEYFFLFSTLNYPSLFDSKKINDFFQHLSNCH